MIIEVICVRYGGNFNSRFVNLPKKYTNASTEEILAAVFYYGQNEIQERNIRSVSVGDIAILNNEFWSCESNGWEKLERTPISRGAAS